MEYNEKAFAASANKKAMTMWTVVMAVFSVLYALEVVKGLQTVTFYAFLLVCAWVPYVAGFVVLKVKGWHSKLYQLFVGYGYGLFYMYIMLTSPGTLAFTYILPIICMMIIYKNKKFIFSLGACCMAILVFAVIRNYFNGMNTAQDISNYEIQIGVLLFTFIAITVAITHMIKSDEALLFSVQSNLNKVITTVDQVKIASNAVVDGVVVVRELAEENKEGAGIVADSMEDLARKSQMLSENIDSSMEMSKDIDNQVGNVAELVEHIVEISETSVTHAQDSSKQLEKVVESTNVIARLSEDVEAVLKEFRSQFDKVKEETGTIESISNKTNLLALNASIEAARAGESGRGFAVVADEIRNLSMGTANSSGSIMEALGHLEVTSDKMTESITTILNLINESLEAMQAVNESVGMIAGDSKQLGEEIRVVDSAMKQVESANKSMVDNMKQVQNTMVEMTDSVIDSETTTVSMLSKYEETARNVVNIETVVGKLVEELGAGGFMSAKDLSAGMNIKLINKSEKREYNAELISVKDDLVIVKASIQLENILEGHSKKFDVQAVVGNSVYTWNDISVSKMKKERVGHYQMHLDSSPKVVNRRKHPRMPMTNTCDIEFTSLKKTYSGRMVNISAGGYAIAVRAEEFANAIGERIRITIKDFEVLNNKPLTGVIIRSSNDNGTYIVGCRMPEDNMVIQAYVKDKMKN